MHWPDFPALTILGICGEAKCTLQQKLLAKPRKISCGPEGTCLVYSSSSSLNHVLVCRKQRVVEKRNIGEKLGLVFLTSSAVVRKMPPLYF